ncbi:L-type lectin-domain containing receptor kinase S.1 [Magnolia sinica]|uniref:L-type lectin-domain containing receptor kinase S.1 n=1 Tax=Magnolia sinica TaxID=86752 RepID=UPI00265B4B80|nr:L-type lectin-domain containing receptor kinase S.1 [Magnolia sinica]
MGPIRKRSDLGFIPDKPFLSRKHSNSNPIFHFTTCPFIIIIIIITTTTIIPSSSAVDFLFNSFNSTSNVDTILGARIDPPVVRLTNDSDPLSMGRLFYPTRLRMKSNSTANTTTISSFSTSFIFSILPDIQSSPGFGIAFVLSNSEFPDGAIPGQRFGLFPTPTASPTIAPLLAIEFDTGLNPEFNDPDGNHVGIDLNSIVSTYFETAEYYDLSSNESRPIDMRSGQNIHAWIDFDGAGPTINITLAPAGVSKSSRPLINFQDPEIANYISEEMYVGFSASKVTWVEVQRILAWSLSDTGQPARELNTSNLPVFLPPSSSSSPSTGLIAGVTCASVVAAAISVLGCYWYWRRKKREKENQEDVIEDWELEYWPHRFTYEELWTATQGFCKEQLLGFGGFGKVYRGVLVANNSNSIVAVKCVAHDSKQGVREFMAEISSMGRLQHKNLVQMRGWCRRGNELMLVYEYMPNGSLNKWIFDKPEQLLGWAGRRRVLADVAEGLLYLHHGWDQVVLHRDIKSSNVLLDADMRGRLGDFGLAKLYQHGQVPSTTRIVGTLGYLAPELAHTAAPTAATDVYSFGVVMLEVASGRRPIETVSDDDLLLIDWVRDLYELGRVLDAADARIAGEYRADDMETVLKLGLACCHPEPEHRPTMKEVVEMLLAGEEARPPA